MANSSGYRFPNYDRTVSVIDLATFSEIKKIDVAINLDHVKADCDGDIYVTSRGDLYCFDKTGKKKWSVVTGDIPGHFAFIKAQ